MENLDLLTPDQLRIMFLNLFGLHAESTDRKAALKTVRLKMATAISVRLSDKLLKGDKEAFFRNQQRVEYLAHYYHFE